MVQYFPNKLLMWKRKWNVTSGNFFENGDQWITILSEWRKNRVKCCVLFSIRTVQTLDHFTWTSRKKPSKKTRFFKVFFNFFSKDVSSNTSISVTAINWRRNCVTCLVFMRGWVQVSDRLDTSEWQIGYKCVTGWVQVCDRLGTSVWQFVTIEWKVG